MYDAGCGLETDCPAFLFVIRNEKKYVYCGNVYIRHEALIASHLKYTFNLYLTYKLNPN